MSKKPAWFRDAHRAVSPMFSYGDSFDALVNSAPPWVQNVVNQLDKSLCRAYNLKDVDTNAAKLGIMTAILDSCSQIDFVSLSKKKVHSSELRKAFKELPRIFKPVQKIQGTIALKLERVIRKQPVATQIEFYNAYERAKDKAISPRNEPAFWETSATRIYIFLLLLSPLMDKVESVDMLDKILSRSGGGLWISRDPKRLQKLCQRIGLKFKKPGRPKLRQSFAPA